MAQMFLLAALCFVLGCIVNGQGYQGGQNWNQQQSYQRNTNWNQNQGGKNWNQQQQQQSNQRNANWNQNQGGQNWNQQQQQSNQRNANWNQNQGVQNWQRYDNQENDCGNNGPVARSNKIGVNSRKVDDEPRSCGNITEMEACKIRNMLLTYGEPEDMKRYNGLLSKIMEMQSNGNINADDRRAMEEIGCQFKELAASDDEEGYNIFAILNPCMSKRDCRGNRYCVDTLLLRTCEAAAMEGFPCSTKPHRGVYDDFPPCMRGSFCNTGFVEPVCSPQNNMRNNV